MGDVKEKNKRKYFDIAQKLHLIEYIQINPKMSFSKIAEYFSGYVGREVTKSAVFKIAKKRDKILEMGTHSNLDLSKMYKLKNNSFDKLYAIAPRVPTENPTQGFDNNSLPLPSQS